MLLQCSIRLCLTGLLLAKCTWYYQSGSSFPSLSCLSLWLLGQWLRFSHCSVPLFMFLSLFRELRRNRIRVVESLIFKELKALKSLKMQRNGITKLMDGALFGLENMEELWVNAFRVSPDHLNVFTWIKVNGWCVFCPLPESWSIIIWRSWIRAGCMACTCSGFCGWIRTISDSFELIPGSFAIAWKSCEWRQLWP